MKASEVIEQLSALVQEHGDLECEGGGGDPLTTVVFNDDLSLVEDADAEGFDVQPPVFIIE